MFGQPPGRGVVLRAHRSAPGRVGSGFLARGDLLRVTGNDHDQVPWTELSSTGRDAGAGVYAGSAAAPRARLPRLPRMNPLAHWDKHAGLWMLGNRRAVRQQVGWICSRGQTAWQGQPYGRGISGCRSLTMRASVGCHRDPHLRTRGRDHAAGCAEPLCALLLLRGNRGCVDTAHVVDGSRPPGLG